MKMIKFALLTTAALTAVTVSARASELSDLKAQIEALNARMAVAEAQTAVPAGFSLIQIGRADAIVIPSLDVDAFAPKTAHTISVVPTADMPASTVIQWSGYVRAAVTYNSVNPSGTVASASETNIAAKYGIKVVGTTDTAVGEVGAKIALAGNANASHADNLTGGSNTAATSASQYYANWNTAASVAGDGFWGWWKVTPELTLGGGRDGSVSGNGEGFDGRANAMYAGSDANGGYKTVGDIAQFRLSYASGPIAAAIAVEDGHSWLGIESNFGVAGEIKYSGDTFGVELNGGMQNTGVFHAEDIWTVNAGAHIALADMFTVSAAAGMGSGVTLVDDYTKASIWAKATLSDAMWVEAGVSHRWNTQAATTAGDVTAFGAGIYYSPVSQLTIGLEADYNVTGASASKTNAALLANFAF